MTGELHCRAVVGTYRAGKQIKCVQSPCPICGLCIVHCVGHYQLLETLARDQGLGSDGYFHGATHKGR